MKDFQNISIISDKALQEKGFLTDFPKAVIQEVNSLNLPASFSEREVFKDLRDKPWISIDNDDSLDLDQITYSEQNKVYVAISDVDALVTKGSPLDQYAAHNTTSIYIPGKVYPMLPFKLSTNLTSLNETRDRRAIVIEMDIENNGKFSLKDVYLALVNNHAKLAYNGVRAWIEQKIPLPGRSTDILEQVILQDSLAQKIKKYRMKEGALSFPSLEVEPVFERGELIGLKEKIFHRGHSLISNFMIAANSSIASYFDRLKLPSLKRVVREPARWDRIVFLARSLGDDLPTKPDVKALRDFLIRRQKKDPGRYALLSLAVIKLIGKGEYILDDPNQPSPGHFDLALTHYSHNTAPNRRFPDLIMQRLLKSQLHKKKEPYSKQELSQIAAHCTQKEDDATKVERRLHKSIAAIVLEPKIGQTFKAMITGASKKGTWVKITEPPVEGKLVKGFEGKDVGDHLNVRLIHVNVKNGHIDFETI
ncbi:MAG TPA: RNB domain-containing ribonuclease [Chlamydiales bacterium]|nr:RNB domain-containing ribonuclease [Chlamydiales bacterium]